MGEDAAPGEQVYLDVDDALALYAAIIGGTDQQAADQLRDRAGLQGALGRPLSYAHYEDADLALQAAVLAHGIAESQTFMDANKRLALVAMLTFLEVNGFVVDAADQELAGWILSLSTGTPPAQLAEILRDRLRPGS